MSWRPNFGTSRSLSDGYIVRTVFVPNGAKKTSRLLEPRTSIPPGFRGLPIPLRFFHAGFNLRKLLSLEDQPVYSGSELLQVRLSFR